MINANHLITTPVAPVVQLFFPEPEQPTRQPAGPGRAKPGADQPHSPDPVRCPTLRERGDLQVLLPGTPGKLSCTSWGKINPYTQ